MKRHFRYLTFLFLLLGMLLGPALTRPRTTSAQDDIPPACLTYCQQLLFQCFSANVGSNGKENHCLAEYRHCLARCKND